MKTKLLAIALFLATIGGVIAYPLHQAGGSQPPVATDPLPLTEKKPKSKPKIDAVFVLDTTGSMSGLIQAAKENIWSIARTMASADPAPDLRIGLVAFRDRGDEYVTRVVDLSSDLDSTYATLMDFAAAGGGDGPESVNQALYDAVHKIQWSQGADSYRVIFLVGDAPAHMDYPNEVKYPETLKAAAAKGIVVNTIQAGGNPSTQQEWRKIAGLNQGSYFQVSQGGNAVAVTTPFDEKLARLSRELDDTRLYYGDAEQRRAMAAKQAATDKLTAGASLPSKAKRAEFNASDAGKKNLLGEKELVDDVSAGRVDLEALPAASLPEPMRALSKQEQQKLVQQHARKRAKLQAEIRSLGDQRQAYIEEELKKDEADAPASLDYKIFSTVKEQAESKGLNYPEAPKY